MIPLRSSILSYFFIILFADIWKFDAQRFETAQPHCHLMTYSMPSEADIGLQSSYIGYLAYMFLV